MLPNIPGVKVGISVTVPTEEIRQQVREELAKVMTAAGYPLNGGQPAKPSRPALRVITGGGGQQ